MSLCHPESSSSWPGCLFVKPFFQLGIPVLIKDLIKRKLISNKVLRLTDFDNLVHMDHNRVVLVGGSKNV